MTGIFSISVLMCKSIRADLTPRMPLRILILLVMLVQACLVSAQNKAAINTGNAFRILADRGEIVIRFVKPGDHQMEFLTRILSVDKVINDTVYAYANSKQFETFLGTKYLIRNRPGTLFKNNPQNIAGSPCKLAYTISFLSVISEPDGFLYTEISRISAS